MSDILQKIVEHKRAEVAAAKRSVSVAALQQLPAYNRSPLSAEKAIRNSSAPAVIAEFKRRSPSKGWINEHANVSSVIPSYCAHGASCISVLTDETFFGGSAKDLQEAAAISSVPLLRKDFMIDPYQLHEAKAWGADIILLIAAILSPEQTKALAHEANELGLSVLLELHDASELNHISAFTSMIGVNNRNLRSFEVSVSHSLQLAAQLPEEVIKIAESGIADAATACELCAKGFDGLLIGEYFMRHNNPGEKLQQFRNEFKACHQENATY